MYNNTRKRWLALGVCLVVALALLQIVLPANTGPIPPDARIVSELGHALEPNQ